MLENRSNKSTKNLLYGIIAQLVQSVFPFIARTVFIYTLGQSYLGISSLFTSILTVLSLAELGLGNTVIYTLYKPVAERDHEKNLRGRRRHFLLHPCAGCGGKVV